MYRQILNMFSMKPMTPSVTPYVKMKKSRKPKVLTMRGDERPIENKELVAALGCHQDSLY